MMFSIKDSGGSLFLEISVQAREESEGWLTANVSFQRSGFDVSFDFSLMANDLYAFRDSLAQLNQTLKQPATFTNIEHNINLIFEPDPTGHIFVKGSLRSPTDYDLHTTFVIVSDQTFLAPMLREVDYMLSNYKTF